MKSRHVVAALVCLVFVSISHIGWCDSKPTILAQQSGGSTEDVARSQAELEQLVRQHQDLLARLERAGNRQAVAQVTNQLGSVYFHYGRPEQAVQWFEKALNLAQQIEDRSTQINALINLGLVLMNTGKYERAAKSYEKVLELSRGIADPGLSAMVQQNLGILYFQWGKPDKSVEAYEKSIALRRKMGDAKWEAITLLNLGQVYSHMGKQDKALEAFETSQSMLQRMEQTKEIKIGRAGALTRLAMVYTAKGQYAKAVESLEKCRSLAREFNDLKMQADALAQLANVSFYRGQYKEAARHGNDSLKLMTERNDQRGVASALTNLGILYSSIGEYGQASDYFQKALKVAEDVRDDRERSEALINLGTVCSDRGQYNEAIKHFGQALDLCKTIRYAKGEAVVCSNLGRLYLDQGRYDKATEHYKNAYSAFSSQGMENEQAAVVLNLGRIREADGDPEAALKQYEQGLGVLKKLKVPTNWPNKLIGDLYLDMGQLQKAEQYLNQAQADSSLGRLCLRKSAYDKAKGHYRAVLEAGEKNRNAEALFTANTGLGLACEGLSQLEQAAGHFRKATEYTEQLRATLRQSERDRFLDVKVGGFSRTAPYEGLARVLMKMNKPLDALNNSEYTKARVFAESMAGRTQSSTRGVPDDVLKRDTLLNDQVAALTKNLEAAYEKSNKEAINNQESQLKEARAKLETHIADMRKRYPLFGACRYPQPSDLSQTALTDDEWVVSYDVTDLGVLAYLTKGRKLVKALFKPIPRKDLDDLVSKFRQPMEMPEAGVSREKLSAFDFVAGKKLSDLLLADVLPDLPKDAPITVVPDDCLGLLPFEMLALNDGGRINVEAKIPQTTGADFFGDRNPVSYYQSITAITLARTLGKRQKLGDKTLAMVNPVFSVDDPRLVKMTKQEKQRALELAPRDIMASYRSRNGLSFGPLPETGQLGISLRNADPENTVLYEGLAASKANLLGKNLNVFRSVVFGTHGYVGNDLAGIQEPVLVLTLVDQPTETYGFLRMSEVMDLKLSADIVALTACQSGLGKQVSGEGTMGMGRAFQYAGAKSVLMSLWAVSEFASVNLMKSFFKNLKSGKSKLEALKLARDEIRKAGYDHPFYWAAFILVGEIN